MCMPMHWRCALSRSPLAIVSECARHVDNLPCPGSVIGHHSDPLPWRVSSRLSRHPQQWSFLDVHGVSMADRDSSARGICRHSGASCALPLIVAARPSPADQAQSASLTTTVSRCSAAHQQRAIPDSGLFWTCAGCLRLTGPGQHELLSARAVFRHSDVLCALSLIAVRCQLTGLGQRRWPSRCAAALALGAYMVHERQAVWTSPAVTVSGHAGGVYD